MLTQWRNLEDGRGVLLRVTAAGLDALGIEPEVAQEPEAPQRPGAGRTDSSDAGESLSAGSDEGASASHTAPLRGKTREGTKQAALIAMLQRPEGATIGEVVEATARGALAGALSETSGRSAAPVTDLLRPAGQRGARRASASRDECWPRGSRA